MKLSIYFDGPAISESEGPLLVTVIDLPSDDAAGLIFTDRAIPSPKNGRLFVDVSKAAGLRYRVAVRDGAIPLLVTMCAVDPYSNARARYGEGVFLNVHVEGDRPAWHKEKYPDSKV